MNNRIGMIGLKPEELALVQTLLRLLRHPDPVVSEVTREALGYLEVLELKCPPRFLATDATSESESMAYSPAKPRQRKNRWWI
jgi:hypothetical protein